jgi:hypothetical protein
LPGEPFGFYTSQSIAFNKCVLSKISAAKKAVGSSSSSSPTKLGAFELGSTPEFIWTSLEFLAAGAVLMLPFFSLVVYISPILPLFLFTTRFIFILAFSEAVIETKMARLSLLGLSFAFYWAAGISFGVWVITTIPAELVLPLF